MRIFLLIVAIIFLHGVNIIAQNAPNSIMVWAKDGVKVAYSLSENVKFSFKEGNLVINTDHVEISYPLSQMERISYEYVEIDTSVKNLSLQNSSVPFNFNSNCLLFPTSPNNRTIAVYDNSGMLLLKEQVAKNDCARISLVSFSQGIYLVKVDNVTYKILKK